MDLDEKEIQKVSDLLAKLEPGKLPLPIFLQVARLTVTPILEIVPLRKNSAGEVEVLLTKREEDDPNWPGMYHTPGTVIRASDTQGSFKDAFKRILEGELEGIKTGQPVFVKNIFHKFKRGMEYSALHWVEVKQDAKTGNFFKISNLPANIVDTQIEFIQDAAKDFQAKK